MQAVKSWVALAVCSVAASLVACAVADPGSDPGLDVDREVSALGSIDSDLGSVMGTPAATGTLNGATNDWEPSLTCVLSTSGLGSGDVAYKWTAPVAGSYTFTTAGSDSTTDTVLHLYDFNTGSALGCNDNVALGNYTSSVTVTLAAGQAIVVVVDGYGQYVYFGFKLNIAYTCPTAPNACYTSPGTWNGSSCVYTPKAAGTSCNDGNACTTGDVCNGSGVCGGTQITCNHPPNNCYQSTGTCSGGTCVYSPKPYGSDCSTNECWLAECNGSGTCSNTNWLCEVGEICRYGTCQPKY